jgi:hypothetical protein
MEDINPVTPHPPSSADLPDRILYRGSFPRDDLILSMIKLRVKPIVVSVLLNNNRLVGRRLVFSSFVRVEVIKVDK